MSNNPETSSVGSKSQEPELPQKFQYLRLKNCERREDGKWYKDDSDDDVLFEVDTDRILRACKDHGLLFSEKRLRHIQNELKMVEKNNDIYTAIDIYGNKHRTRVRQSGELRDGEYWKYEVGYNFLCHLADDRCGSHHTVGNHAKEISSLTINKSPGKIAAIEDCTGNGVEDEGRFARWTSKWEQSSVREGICSFLAEYASKMKQVRKIVCLGLGCIAPYGDDENQLWENWWEGHYEQHLIAVTIRDVLKEHGHPIENVYAQDPAYCKVGTKYIESTFGIKILPGMDGVMEVDEHTFVVSWAPAIPVLQICTHKTWPKGVAGMLGHPIVEDGTVEKQRYYKKKLKGCGWDGFGIPTTDDPDPYVYEWAQRCYEEVLPKDLTTMAIYLQPQSPPQSSSASDP